MMVLVPPMSAEKDSGINSCFSSICAVVCACGWGGWVAWGCCSSTRGGHSRQGGREDAKCRPAAPRSAPHHTAPHRPPAPPHLGLGGPGKYNGQHDANHGSVVDKAGVGGEGSREWRTTRLGGAGRLTLSLDTDLPPPHLAHTWRRRWSPPSCAPAPQGCSWECPAPVEAGARRVGRRHMPGYRAAAQGMWRRAVAQGGGTGHVAQRAGVARRPPHFGDEPVHAAGGGDALCHHKHDCDGD